MGTHCQQKILPIEKFNNILLTQGNICECCARPFRHVMATIPRNLMFVGTPTQVTEMDHKGVPFPSHAPYVHRDMCDDKCRPHKHSSGNHNKKKDCVDQSML